MLQLMTNGSCVVLFKQNLLKVYWKLLIWGIITTKKSLSASEIVKSEKRVLTLMSVLSDTFIDPFEHTLDPQKLFDIASGSSVSDEVSTCLLDIYGRGITLYDQFASRFTIGVASKKTFWSEIKRQE